MREIGDIVREFRRRPRERWALATLVRTWGSSYRPPGARMLIPAQGRAVGSLSGGCLEEEVIAKAGQVLRTGQAELMTFDTRRRFGCNGGLEILVEKIPEHFLTELSAHWEARRPCLISTVYSGANGSRIIDSTKSAGDGELLQQIDPSIQLLLLGDGPDSSPLADMAGILGWSVKAMDNASELDGTYDGWTAAVVKTHNYGRDFAALRALFSLDLRYIGLMGPRARREQLIGDLLDTGVVPSANLFAPAGLDLGGGTPEAIALAIVAEIQTVFTGGSLQSLRDRKAPIHAHPAAPLPASMQK
jgi:xanthine dehydrogenase accessory factor